MAKSNINILNTKLHTDTNPIEQPKGTHRFALNAVNEARDGQQGTLSNERANFLAGMFDQNYFPIGEHYIGNDENVVICNNSTSGRDQIVSIRSGIVTVLVDTTVLGLKITNQCDIRFRIRKGNERVIYWVDGINVARTFNLDKPFDYYSSNYKDYLKAGNNPNNFTGEKWDGSSFDLIKTYKTIPFFSNVQIIETGSIMPGSYNFAIQYVDDDLNPTDWITTSNTVNIFNDSVTSPFHRIRGSKNVDTIAQSFPKAAKSIKLTITNLDTNFPFYRVAIIQATGGTGDVTNVLASDIQSTHDSNFLYTGNDSQLTKVQLGEILIDKAVIFAPKHIEQLENRLLLLATEGKSINWCDFQHYASKIGTDLVTKQVFLNSVQSDANVKNPKSTFVYRGYMPGEAYSFGIAYLFDDGFISPAFHIPGKDNTDTHSKMKYHDIDSRYLDVHNCSTNNYWSKDKNNNTLVGNKIRHHRFPFRKEVTKPLVSTTSTSNTITKYRIKVVFSLNPSFTPSPNVYPVDSNNEAIAIDYLLTYQVTGAVNTETFSGTITSSDMNEIIYIYDDMNDVSLISGVYALLDPTCMMATQYQTGGNNRFIVTSTRESYAVSSDFSSDSSEIFGIELSNIEKPHPNVVGFYIVRQERTDDDKIVVDNAIFGAMTQYQNYRSFGLINPKRYYTANNCGLTGIPNKTLTYHQNGVWFFNPEYQFFGSKTDFDDVVIEGNYAETSTDMPTISNTTGSACNYLFPSDQGKSKGLYVEDVQAGTTYNPDINKAKNRDDDGFDLIVGYRNVRTTFNIDNTTVFPTKKTVIYLNAASYQNFENNIYYNTSVDNKIGEYLVNGTINTSLFNNPGSNNSTLLYGSLVKNNTSSYANFINRTYFKEHNNPVMFGVNNTINGVKVFNGDTEISALNLISSVYYDMVLADRAKKSKVWKIVAGVILVAASIAATVFSAGAASGTVLAAIGTLATIGISYGVSLAASGIKFEQFKNMIETDYNKGLKETITDGGVFECIREGVGRKDDTFRWFSDMAQNIYIESSVPFGIRSGLTSGVSDFLDAPNAFDEQGLRTYLTEKFTTLDRDQGSGRLYKGYAGAELYDVNKDYIRFNREKEFIHLPIEYDCCADKNEIFPTRIWDSQQSFQEENVDNYRVFLPNNYKDIEGEHGEITGVFRLGNGIFVHTREGLWQIPQAVQERVTGEVVSFIGTGSFLSIPIRKVIDDNMGSGGTSHKWGTIKTSNGVFWIDETEGRVYLFTDSPKNISNIGMRNWFKNHAKSYLGEQLRSKLSIEFPNTNNPANPNGIGYHSAYDTRHERIILTKKDYLVTSDKISSLALVPLISQVPKIGFVYCAENARFYIDGGITSFSNKSYFEDKSWTISFSFYTNGWVSWHSYLPKFYISSKKKFYSVDGNQIFEHNSKGIYQTFFGVYYKFIVEYVESLNPIEDEILEDITLQTTARRFSNASGEYVDQRFITFNKIIAYNSKGCTGEQIIKVKEAQPLSNWYSNQTNNTNGIILISRRDRDWNINDLRDYVVDYTKPFFTSNWEAIKDQYFMDKVIDGTVVSFNKPWNELESLKDKFNIVRLIFDNFNDVNLTLNFTLQNEEE